MSINEPYANKVKKLEDRLLRKKHHTKTRDHHACLVSIAWGIALAPCSAGLTLMGTTYSAKQIHVLHQHVAAVKQEIANRGLEIPRHRKRDWAYGVLLGLSGAFIGKGIAKGCRNFIKGFVLPDSATIGAHLTPGLIDAEQDALTNDPDDIDGAIQEAQNGGMAEIQKFGDDLKTSAFNAPTLLSTGDAKGDAKGGGKQLDVAAIDATQKQLGSAITKAATENSISKSERPGGNPVS